MPAAELKMIRNRMPATSEETMPMRIVSPMVIGSGPGRARRPRLPTIAPQTHRAMTKAMNAMEDLLGPAASAAGPGPAPLRGEPQVQAADEQDRQDQPGHHAQHHPDHEPDRQPGHETDAERLGNGPLLLPGEGGPQRHATDETLDHQSENETDHGRTPQERRPRPARRGTSISSGLRLP